MEKILKSSYYKRTFVEGLQKLLWAYNDYPSRVVVLANAFYSEEILRNFSSRDLADAMAWCRRSHRHLAEIDLSLSVNKEDQMVFEEVQNTGIGFLETTELRTVGQMLAMYNIIRGFRPPGAAADKVDSIHYSYDPRKHAFFSKAFIKKECFWPGKLAGRNVEFFYNKFPFLEYHGLIVVNPPDGLPQEMTPELNEWIWHLLGEADDRFVIGFNSVGAYASKMQLHFQICHEYLPFPVMRDIWKHDGGPEEYPACLDVFDNVIEAGKWIEEVNSRDIAHNLLYTPGKAYFFARKFQGQYEHDSWTSGFAFAEMAGRMITSNYKDYCELTEEMIEDEFKELNLLL